MPPPEGLHHDPVAQAVEIALLKQLVEQQGFQITHLIATVKGLEATINGVSTQLAEARGGWRTLVWLGGASASLGAAASWALQHLKVSP